MTSPFEKQKELIDNLFILFKEKLETIKTKEKEYENKIKEMPDITKEELENLKISLQTNISMNDKNIKKLQQIKNNLESLIS